jgi:hypothetical protein
MRIAHASRSLSSSTVVVFVPEQPIAPAVFEAFLRLYPVQRGCPNPELKITLEDGNVCVHTPPTLLPHRFDEYLQAVMTDAEEAIRAENDVTGEQAAREAYAKERLMGELAQRISVPIRD